MIQQSVGLFLCVSRGLRSIIAAPRVKSPGYLTILITLCC